MKFIFDLFPVGLFFLAYQWGGIYWATGSAILASVLQIGILLALRKPVDATAWIGFGVITIFGGLTLWSHQHHILGIEPTVFIRWKPTALYWIFSLILLLGPPLFKRNPMRALLSKQMHLPESLWARLNLAWGVFFFAMGLLNLYVAFSYPEAVWVKFKVFGLMALMILFVVAQGVFLARHLEEPK
ncbi:MAG: septation protein A [Ferrovum sp.]|nr:septation protein A [Ferrovum sp.]NDU86956.1 septation protein A [Ferrovum sp.]